MDLRINLATKKSTLANLCAKASLRQAERALNWADKAVCQKANAKIFNGTPFEKIYMANASKSLKAANNFYARSTNLFIATIENLTSKKLPFNSIKKICDKSQEFEKINSSF